MQDPTVYRQYARECERLAEQGLSEHKASLLSIAKAWYMCADEAERIEKMKNGKVDGHS